MNLRNSKFLRP